MSQRDQMAQMFDAIDADGRRYVLAILQHEFDRVQRARHPALQLVDSGPAVSPALAAAAQRPARATVTQLRTRAVAGRQK